MPELPRSGNRERPASQHWAFASKPGKRRLVDHVESDVRPKVRRPALAIAPNCAVYGCRALVGGADGNDARPGCALFSVIPNRVCSDSARGSGKPRHDARAADLRAASSLDGVLVFRERIATRCALKASSDIETVEIGRIAETRLVEIVFPGETNHYGTLFGGRALALMDKAAFIAASRYARCAIVTASSERVDFRIPVHQGELVELIARVVATGRTSMTVHVDLIAEELLTGRQQLATRGRFVLVAVDAQGRPAAIPPLPTGAGISPPTGDRT